MMHRDSEPAWRQTAVGLAVFALASLPGAWSPPAMVWAAAGDLDPSFGSGGIVTTVVGSGPLASSATAIALQPDGRIVAAGFSTENGVALVRYTTAGALDASFGSGGIVTSGVGTPSAVALQPDGRVVVMGTASNLQPCGPMELPVEFANLALARYLPDGSLDASFGSGGTVTTVLPCTSAAAYAGALQADGRIVVAGTLNTGVPPSTLLLARYTADGGLDASFGSGGMTTTAIGDLANEAHALALQPDGRIVVAGHAEMEFGPPHFALARYTTAGGLDPGFGSGGTVTTAIGPYFSQAAGIALLPDGAIVAAGFAETASFTQELALARYTAAGLLDARFGSGGTVTTAIGPSAKARAIALQPDGRLVVAGYWSNPAADTEVALARFTTGGRLDTSFGDAGVVVTAIGTGATARAVALQPDGRIVAAGAAFDGTAALALVRYLGQTCPPAPRACRTAGRSVLHVRNASDGHGDRLTWTWTRGAATSRAELGDPTGTTNYALCLYAGTTSALVGEALVPAGASRWSPIGITGYRYRDRTAAEGGVRKVRLKGSDADRARVLVRGTGAYLPDLPLPVAAPVTVQLVHGDTGLCWGAAYDASQLLANTSARLDARAP